MAKLNLEGKTTDAKVWPKYSVEPDVYDAEIIEVSDVLNVDSYDKKEKINKIVFTFALTNVPANAETMKNYEELVATNSDLPGNVELQYWCTTTISKSVSEGYSDSKLYTLLHKAALIAHLADIYKGKDEIPDAELADFLKTKLIGRKAKITVANSKTSNAPFISDVIKFTDNSK